MSEHKDPNGLQKAVDQIGIVCIREKYEPKGFKVCNCEVHGYYLAPAGEENPQCPRCQEVVEVPGGNGTTATEVEHYINVRDMVVPPTNPHP